jgi:hypothetical protein
MSGRVRVDLKVILRVGIVAGGLQEFRTQGDDFVVRGGDSYFSAGVRRRFHRGVVSALEAGAGRPLGQGPGCRSSSRSSLAYCLRFALGGRKPVRLGRDRVPGLRLLPAQSGRVGETRLVPVLVL